MHAEHFRLLMDYDVTLIHRQFCPNLALANHTPRSYAGFSDFHVGKVKKVCDIDLTHVGYGALCLVSSLPV